MDLAKLEAEAFLLGQWRNFEELEENLCIDELNAILDAARTREHERNKFTAALKGINLDEGSEESVEERIEAVKRRAQARLTGKTEEQLELESIGIGIEIEEEEE